MKKVWILHLKKRHDQETVALFGARPLLTYALELVVSVALIDRAANAVVTTFLPSPNG